MERKDNRKTEKHVFSTIDRPKTSLKELNGHRIKDVEEDLYKNVLYQLKERRIYLMPDLSLIKLSQIVGTNTSYLSSVVNRHFGMNFRRLVNTYRVRHATRLLEERGVEETTKLDTIIQLSGFSSRSVFYEAFIKITGKTPQQYIREKKMNNIK